MNHERFPHRLTVDGFRQVEEILDLRWLCYLHLWSMSMAGKAENSGRCIVQGGYGVRSGVEYAEGDRFALEISSLLLACSRSLRYYTCTYYVLVVLVIAHYSNYCVISTSTVNRTVAR